MNDENELYKTWHALRFYATPEHPCSYLDNRIATTLFVDPTIAISSDHYALLSTIGFRRSGEHVYRPHCKTCRACIPVRIPTKEFKPNRSQQRAVKSNPQVDFVVKQTEFDEEQFQLYRRYMQARHPGGGMDSDDPEAYIRVISSSWAETCLFEFRDNQQLLAVAVVDRFKDSLSAVYTFFNPDMPKRSLGVYVIMRQIQYCLEQRLSWLYLGYWNRESEKMAYKTNYRPSEIYDGAQWKRA